jgi:hypothetical protein
VKLGIPALWGGGSWPPSPSRQALIASWDATCLAFPSPTPLVPTHSAYAGKLLLDCDGNPLAAVQACPPEDWFDLVRKYLRDLAAEEAG